MGPVRLSLKSTRERLFLSALLDALATGVERALASRLGGQLLASLLVCIVELASCVYNVCGIRESMYRRASSRGRPCRPRRGPSGPSWPASRA